MDIKTEGDTTKKTCILVNDDDEVLRIGNLVECHTVPMKLHRAFSVFIFDENGRLLLQQRAKTKYTFPLSWTNSICSHPRDLSRSIEEWVDLRIKDEFDGWDIKNVQTRLISFGKLLYEARSDDKYGEKELDILFYLKVTNEEKAAISANPAEIERLTWLSDSELDQFICNDSNLITPWFREIYDVFRPLYKNLSIISDTHTDELKIHRAGNLSFQRANAESDHLLQLPFSYLSSNPGKKIRTLLCRVCAEIDTSIKPEHVKSISHIVERIHASSLLHDDIEDKSSSRRGAPCAHLIYGAARVINTGCFNYFKALKTVDETFHVLSDEHKYKMTQLILDTLCNLHRAQGADILWAENNFVPNREQYLEMIDGKTSALFMLCASLSGICGDKELANLVAINFREFGRFFQIRDDYINICDPDYWKEKGFFEDADEGKKSYPVVLYLSKGNAETEEKEFLLNMLSSNETKSPEMKLKAYSLLHKSGILDETREDCLKLKAKLESSICSTSSTMMTILAKLNICDILQPEEVRSMV